MTASVARATMSASVWGSPSGISLRSPNTMGITVAAMSIITVPATIGVKMRRRSDRRAARANWKSDDATMRAAISVGPPSTSAATQTPMNAPDVPIMRTCPDPRAPDAGGLQGGRDPAHDEGGEHGPRDVGVGLLGGASHDDDGEHDGRDHRRDGLEAGAEGHRRGGPLVGLVAHVRVRVAVVHKGCRPVAVSVDAAGRSGCTGLHKMSSRARE